MEASRDIRYVQHDSIDLHKWDRCIDEATNGLVYVYSFYLDHMSAHWDALVMGDYEYVMPLTWNRKYSFHYLYQPFLVAQAGVFGKNITQDITSSFIDSIPRKFKLVEISLNSGNLFNITSKQGILRVNYLLDLNKPYDILYAGYRDNIRRNIRKATQVGCTTKKNVPVKDVIDLAVQQMRSHTPESTQNVERFNRLFQFMQARNATATYGVLSANGELISSCVFFFSHHRAYYILVGNHPNGRTIGASHMLIDAFVKDYANQGLLLDFEGSDIRNLAFFYSSFGAREENYPALRINRLPFYLRWMKK